MIVLSKGPLSKGGETTAEDVHFSTRDDTLKLVRPRLHHAHEDVSWQGRSMQDAGGILQKSTA